MLILTSDACRDPRLGAAWPGPVLFAALPGHGLRRAELRAMEADAIILDCLEAPPSPGALLCEVATRLPWLFVGIEGPLLLLAAPAGEDLPERRARGLARPRAVEPRWSPEGRLDALLLGEAVARHPLAADALALLGRRQPTDAALLEVLAAALGGQIEGQIEGRADG